MTNKNLNPLTDAFEEAGLNFTDYNGARQTGVARVEFFQKDGARMTSYNAYISPFLKDRKNLKVVPNTRVTKILINKENIAYGVEYAGENMRSITGKVYAKKEVIVSAGALSSPRLLMLSGIGPKKTLETYGIKVIKDLPVGHNLQDHVTTYGFRLLLGKSGSYIPNNVNIVADSLLYKTTGTGPLASVGTLSVSAYINSRYSDPSDDFPDIQYYLPPQYLHKTENGYKAYLSPFAYYNSIFVQPAVLKPKSVGNLTIKSNDPFDDPVIYHNYFQFEEDLNILIDGCNFVAKKLMNTKAFKELGIEFDKTAAPKCVHLEFGTDKYWTCAAKNHTGTTHHFGGSCKMGPSNDSTAVVDPKLKVYGINHLRVVDTSIIPVLPNGNTQAPAQMIAEKAADMIKATWGWKN
ncbi:Glucose dehydrogenase [FAD, quinone] [Blattella germanica]|nr:Glucose dehydrogenase [FAD, quinone] [Blattella germanica]